MNLKQVARDWSAYPYTDLKVVEGEYACPDDYPEAVFFRIFQGSKLGCDCLGISNWDTDYNIGTNENKIEDWHSCN